MSPNFVEMDAGAAMAAAALAGFLDQHKIAADVHDAAEPLVRLCLVTFFHPVPLSDLNLVVAFDAGRGLDRCVRRRR